MFQILQINLHRYLIIAKNTQISDVFFSCEKRPEITKVVKQEKRSTEARAGGSHARAHARSRALAPARESQTNLLR